MYKFHPAAVNYITAIIKTPSGRFIIVGSCPELLSNKSWATEAQAVAALKETEAVKYQATDYTIHYF